MTVVLLRKLFTSCTRTRVRHNMRHLLVSTERRRAGRWGDLNCDDGWFNYFVQRVQFAYYPTKASYSTRSTVVQVQIIPIYKYFGTRRLLKSSAITRVAESALDHYQANLYIAWSMFTRPSPRHCLPLLLLTRRVRIAQSTRFFPSLHRPPYHGKSRELWELRGGSSNQSKNPMTELKSVVEIWDGSNKESFTSLDHPGYSISSDPTTHLGGWLAHRAALEPKTSDNGHNGDAPVDWIEAEIAPHITKFDYSSMPIQRATKILVLYGSLRPASFNRKLAYEFARILELVGCDVRVYNPRGLPVRDPALEDELKVKELRALTLWSDGHVWVSPEMHGTITGVFKNQIDWIPLNTGSVRPTQGKTCCVAQANGGSQSFNAVNALRLLARW
jgi:NAD(P)H-dependent FMN reductase